MNSDCYFKMHLRPTISPLLTVCNCGCPNKVLTLPDGEDETSCESLTKRGT